VNLEARAKQVCSIIADVLEKEGLIAVDGPNTTPVDFPQPDHMPTEGQDRYGISFVIAERK
jgi:hypothetical protein